MGEQVNYGRRDGCIDEWVDNGWMDGWEADVNGWKMDRGMGWTSDDQRMFVQKNILEYKVLQYWSYPSQVSFPQAQESVLFL